MSAIHRLVVTAASAALTVGAGLAMMAPAARSRTASWTAPAARPGSGALFGLAVAPRDGGVYYVDDATNTLRLLH
jgi:hypothetical protein